MSSVINVIPPDSDIGVLFGIRHQYPPTQASTGGQLGHELFPACQRGLTASTVVALIGRSGPMQESLRHHFDGIKDASVRCTTITNERVRKIIDDARDRLKRAPAETIGDDGSVKRIDISSLDPDAIRALLFSFPIECEFVDLVWPYEGTGARMRFLDFVQYYDDLWYPSRDNLWVTAEDGIWVLELDHEEILTFV